MTAPARIKGMPAEAIKRSCTTKNRYPDIMTAVAAGMHQHESFGAKLYTYRCRVCDGWHLTKSKHGRDGNPVTPCSAKVF